jgi:AAA+ superfamily predicted ATPase
VLYLVIEKYVQGAAPVYARVAQRGRMLPAGLVYVDSWVDADGLDRCFQLMETDEPNLFDEWTANWDDIVEFEVVPVIRSSEAAQRIQE